MNILVIDHYFGQDIDALLYTDQQNRYRILSYTYFYDVARKVFSAPVFTGLDTYFRTEYATQRAAYAALVQEALQKIYLEFPFDLVLAPSDTFFWIRSVITATQTLGIPFVVLQKESTIPPGWLNGPAQEWGTISPFIADQMLVSSTHHRQFWINSGCAPEIIHVTGQPRFDLYCQPVRWQPWPALGVKIEPGRRNILFLTYDSSAYLPYIVRDGMTPWAQMRNETEAILVALARDEGYNLLIKAHPQPAEDQSVHLAALARNPNVYILPAQGDTRQFIANSDIVVGFQTTALFEALGAQKSTIYTFWTEPAHQFADTLIPFHQADYALHVARSPAELHTHVRQSSARAPSASELAQREAFFVEYVGPLDGHAAERCLQWFATFVAQAVEQAKPAALALRQSLDERAPAYCRRTLWKAKGAAVLWNVGKAVLPVAYPIWTRLRQKQRSATTYAAYQRLLTERHNQAAERAAYCRERLQLKQ